MGDSARVREWMEERGRAKSTKLGQARQLERFLRRTGLTEDELLKAAKDPKRIARIADRFVDSEKEAGRRPAYALAVWFAAKSFLKSAGVPVAYNPPLEPGEMEPADFDSRRVPSQEELRRFIDTLSLQYRGLVLTLATSGVRIGVIGVGVGSDGLRLENLPDLDVATGSFRAKPPIILVPARLSKAGKAYVTAITTEAALVVETCLAQRVRAGEKLAPKSPLFVPDARGHDRPLRTKEGFRTFNRNGLSNALSARFAKIAPPGVRWTAHTLRAWCSSRLESAESQGLISRTRREFFMGHSLGVDGKYNLARPLSPEAREEIRGSFKKVESFLSTVPVAENTEERDRQTRAELLRMVGCPAGKIEELSRDPEATKKWVTDRLPGAAAAREVNLAPKREGEQRVIPGDATNSYLEAGWTFRSELNGTKAVVEWSRPLT
jgi:integrase